MAFLSRLDIPLSGMMAQRLRLDVISQNISFSTVTNMGDGNPYTRQLVFFSPDVGYENLNIRDYVERKINSMTSGTAFGDLLSMSVYDRNKTKGSGVMVSKIVEDDTPYTPVYDPTHPDAGEDGYYYLPNVDVEGEQFDWTEATNSYDANLSVYTGMIKMAEQALNIGRA